MAARNKLLFCLDMNVIYISSPLLAYCVVFFVHENAVQY